jgi:hypothetical protein
MRLPVPDALLAPARQALESGASEVTDRLAELVAAIPDRHLELLMRTPARRVVIESIFLLMPRYLDRTRVAGLDMAIRWELLAAQEGGEPDIYDLIIAERRCRVTRGESPAQPLVTIGIEPVELLRLAVGRSNPMQAYFGGRLSLRGDIMQAARLTSLFRIPTGAAARA